jgi:microcin C transport system substrate-binding protein
MRYDHPLLAAAAGLAIVGGLTWVAEAQDAAGEWLHGSTLIGELKYPPDFPHFDYVNPDAPKGGLVRLGAFQTGFDSLNVIPELGTLAPGIGLIYETLMTDSLDETSTQYGLLADAFRHPADYSSVTYRLNPDARWHDGRPVTADDVVWSFEIQTEHNPDIAEYYSHVTGAEATGEREITFTFDETGNRELPQIVGQLMVLPKHWFEGRDVAAVSLDPPLGSGPYRVKSVEPGRSVAYERVPDYWGADVNVNVGQNNFDEIRYEIYLDETVLFEAFKADQFDFRSENIARRWANEYNFPAIAEGRVRKEWVDREIDYGEYLGYIFNLRRDKFQDVRVRRALVLAFPFETLNRDLFYGQYYRPDSFFDGIELEAEGIPEGRELELLNEIKDQVPAEVFTTDYTNPINGTPEESRANLRLALQLLTEAGYQLRGNQLVDAQGRQLTVEFLNSQPTFEANALRYKEELAKIGIDFQIRTVDTSQYTARRRAFDYDVIYSGWTQSLSPGNEQYFFFGSESANEQGSRNFAGISNPAVDHLIEKIVFAPDREELVAATRALDRVLSWNYYLVPGWTLRADRIAYWDRFSHPDPLPRFSLGFPTVWWYDQEKAQRVGIAP